MIIQRVLQQPVFDNLKPALQTAIVKRLLKDLPDFLQINAVDTAGDTMWKIRPGFEARFLDLVLEEHEGCSEPLRANQHDDERSILLYVPVLRSGWPKEFEGREEKQKDAADALLRHFFRKFRPASEPYPTHKAAAKDISLTQQHGHYTRHITARSSSIVPLLHDNRDPADRRVYQISQHIHRGCTEHGRRSVQFVVESIDCPTTNYRTLRNLDTTSPLFDFYFDVAINWDREPP